MIAASGDKRSQYNSYLTSGEKTYLACWFFLALAWLCLQRYDYGCDETRRLLIPEYIYAFGRLPYAKDPLVIFQPYGFSYASAFTFLPAILGAAGMKLASIFSDANIVLLVGARLPSLLAGSFSTYITIKISKRLFTNEGARWLFITMLTLLPEFVFLSSFFNSDSVVICFSLLIVWSWIGMRDGVWSKATYAKLIVGLVGCMLSYLNAYVWIPASVIYYFAQGKSQRIQWGKLVTNACAIMAICVLLIAPLLARQVKLYGFDLLGNKVGAEAAAEFADKDFDMDAYDSSPIKRGYSLSDVITGRVCDEYKVSHWLRLSRQSFYGRFDYSALPMPRKLYFAFSLLFGPGIVVGCWIFLRGLKQGKYEKGPMIFYSSLTFAFILINILSIYYSLYNSFQPQARYTMPASLLYICLLAAKGWQYILRNMKRRGVSNCRLFARLLCVLPPILLVAAMVSTFIPTAYDPAFAVPCMDMRSEDWAQYTHPYK